MKTPTMNPVDRPRRTARPTGRTGLTLVELLVAVAILGILSLGFAYVLGSSQRIVTESERMMRANANFQAVSNVVRPDFRGVSTDGFLAIRQTPTGEPFVAFTYVGLQQPTLGTDAKHARPLPAPASVVAMGMCANNAPTASHRVLYRQAWLLRKGPWVGGNWGGGDMWRWPNDDMPEMSEVTAMSPDMLRAMVDRTQAMRPQQIVIPVVTIADIMELWQVLAPQAVAMSVMWTDGQTNDSRALQWYGIDYDREADQYVTVRRTAQPEGPEQSHAPYQALWTHYDRNNWPVAIRLRFWLVDARSPRELVDADVIEYEIVCPIGR